MSSKAAPEVVKIVSLPIPPNGAGRRPGKWIEALKKLRPGTDDSFMCRYQDRPIVYTAAKRLGFKTVTRKIDFDTIGVWRVS